MTSAAPRFASGNSEDPLTPIFSAAAFPSLTQQTNQDDKRAGVLMRAQLFAAGINSSLHDTISELYDSVDANSEDAAIYAASLGQSLKGIESRGAYFVFYERDNSRHLYFSTFEISQRQKGWVQVDLQMRTVRNALLKEFESDKGVIQVVIPSDFGSASRDAIKEAVKRVRNSGEKVFTFEKSSGSDLARQMKPVGAPERPDFESDVSRTLAIELPELG